MSIEVDYLCDGTEREINLASIPNPTYANTTITSGGYSTGSGLTYTSGTSTTWAPAGNGLTAGSIHAKDFIMDGVSLKELVEQRLAWLVPNPELEKEWDELKALGDAYRKLEEECKEKSKVWRALTKTSK